MESVRLASRPHLHPALESARLASRPCRPQTGAWILRTRPRSLQILPWPLLLLRRPLARSPSLLGPRRRAKGRSLSEAAPRPNHPMVACSQKARLSRALRPRLGTKFGLQSGLPSHLGPQDWQLQIVLPFLRLHLCLHPSLRLSFRRAHGVRTHLRRVPLLVKFAISKDLLQRNFWRFRIQETFAPRPGHLLVPRVLADANDLPHPRQVLPTGLLGVAGNAPQTLSVLRNNY